MTAERISAPEAERQVAEAAERYREVITSMQAGGRPEIGQNAAVKAVGRALQLVVFVLDRAAAAGVALERLAELTGFEPVLVQELLERGPEPAVVARAAPAGIDAVAVVCAAESFDAERRLREWLEDLLEAVADDAWVPEATQIDALREQLERTWERWLRQAREASRAGSS